MSGRITVQIEIEMKLSSFLDKNDIMQATQEYLERCHPVLVNGEISFLNDKRAPDLVRLNIENLIVSELRVPRVSFWQADIYYTVYKLLDQEPEKDFLDGEDDAAAFEQWELPNKHLQGIWNSIVVDKDIKRKLIGYCDSSIRFAEASIDPSIISWNRMCLLYGPPGTGKTSLCKALAQQSFIRHSQRFSSGVLLEINSHSLFSKVRIILFP